MKKVLLTLALAAFAFTANAQFVIGGNLGVNHNGRHDKDFTSGNAYTGISIEPKVGYQLNDQMQFGAQISWNYTYNRWYGMSATPGAIPVASYGKDSYESNPVNVITIAPYFRYNFATWKSFTVFCEAQVGIGFGLESKGHLFIEGKEATGSPVKMGDNFTRFSASITPGLNYSINDMFSMDLYIDLLGFQWATQTDANDNNTHNWGLNADMSAQTLMAHLGNFRIGFNYHF